MRNATRIALAGLAWPAFSAAPCHASVVYGTTSSGIYSINVDTGDTALVTQITAPTPLNLSGGAPPGHLYVTGGQPDVLLSVNLTTHAVTTIGVTTHSNSLGEGGDGLLYYGETSTFGWINPASGASGVIASTLPFGFGGDIATSPSGQTYGSFLGNTLGMFNRQAGLQGTVALPATMYGLAFSQDGRFWGVDPTGGLYRIDPASGNSTLVFNLGLSLLDLASEPVPAPSAAWILLGAPVVLRRNRR